MFLELIKHLLNGLYVLFAFGFGVNKDVIEVHYYENNKPLWKDLIYITLERNWCNSQSKRLHLVLEMTITGLESYFLFIAVSDSYLMVGIGLIKLGKMSSLT